MDQGYPWLNSNKDVDNDLLMDVSELSVCLGSLTHDVCQSTKILEQQSAPLGGYSERVLLANFRLRFKQLKLGADGKESVLLEARGNRLLQLYKELMDLEPDEGKRCKLLILLYELFDSDRKKSENLKVVKSLPSQNGFSEINSPQNLPNSKDFQLCKPHTLEKSLIGKIDSYDYVSANLSDSLNIPAIENTRNYAIPSDDSHDNDKNYILYNKSKNYFLDKEDDADKNNPRRNIYCFMKNIQYLENAAAKSEIIKAPGEQFQTDESELLIEELPPVAENESNLNLMPESWKESEQGTLSTNFHGSRLTFSNRKSGIFKNLDIKLSVTSVRGQPVSDVEVPIENHPDNYEHGKIIRDVNESVASLAEIKRRPAEKVYWEHQYNIIIAPRVVIQLFKSNPAYKCAQAPNFYEQVNQLFEIIGQRNSSQKLPFEARSIQSRLIKILHKIKRELPRNISYSEWVTAVGKYQLNQILSSEEMRAYETLCRHLRDDESTSSHYPSTEESRFRDALMGMMGHESQLLKASSVTGRLQIRAPHHQESVGESYLLLTLGLLGYLYRSLKDQLRRLEKRGDTGAYLMRGFRKTLQTFREFCERRKNHSCSLLRLYWQTREYQLLLKWLLEVLVRINQGHGQAIIVSLYEESCRRTGEQWRLLQMLLSEASKPLVSKLDCWLSLGQLTASTNDEFIIERSLTSGTDEFWQHRYRLSAPFVKFFSRQLAETMISVGKTVAYSKKYLSRNGETPLISTEINRKLLHLLTHFYLHGDQQPLFDFLYKLHSDVSGKVLSFLRNINPPPKALFYQMHNYLIVTDMQFYSELMQALEGLLREPASTFNIKLFNIILNQTLPRQIADIYVDKSAGQGSECWSCFLIRMKLPDYWRALLGEDIKEYEAIYSGLWKFHYANYVLSEMVPRRKVHIHKRTKTKPFDCIDQVDQLFDTLFGLFLDAMSVLKSYLLTELLEPAYSKLRIGCEEAKTVDDMLNANRTYLRTIRLGSFQTKGLRKCNMYLEQLYDGIMGLDFHEQKFYRLVQNFRDYLTKYGGQTIGSGQFLIPSYELTNRKREFRWSCQNTIDALINLKDQFHKAMLDLLYSLHLEDLESFRKLAQKLDQNGYYERMDQRLQLVQRFEFKRKRERKEGFLKNAHYSKQ